MRFSGIALAALFALVGCHKTNPNPQPPSSGITPAEASGIENSAGSFPSGPAAGPGNSGVGTTGVTEPIDQPPAPNTPTH